MSSPTSPQREELLREFDAMLKQRMDALAYVEKAQGHAMAVARLDAWTDETQARFKSLGLLDAARDVRFVRGPFDFMRKEIVELRPNALRHFLGETASHVLDGTFVLARVPSPPAAPGHRSPASAVDPKRVFLVHGRNDGPPAIVARTLQGMGLEPIILKEQPHKGRTIIEKFEDEADVGFAVVLLTSDDEGRLKGDADLAPRARQNVVLELGWFFGRRGRDRVCALVEEGIEMPSDLGGLGHVTMDGPGAWKLDLAKELEAAGYAVDRAGIK